MANGQGYYRNPWGYRGYQPQGYGFYNPWMKGPDWGQGMATFMQNLVQAKQMREQQKMRELQKQQIMQQQDAKLRQQAYMRWLGEKFPQLGLWTEGGQQPPAEAMLKASGIKTQETPEEKIKRIESEAEARARGTIKGQPPKETFEERIKRIEAEVKTRAEITARYRPKRQPSAFEVKQAAINQAVKEGRMTQKQADMSLFNLKQQVTPEEERAKGASIRDRNQKEMNSFYAALRDDGLIEKGGIKTKFLREQREKQGEGTLESSQGYRLDMPEKYNRAVLNKKDGVAINEDEETINRYDAMFEKFQKEYLPKYPKFSDWMKAGGAKLKNIDVGQIRIWYEIYRL